MMGCEISTVSREGPTLTPVPTAVIRADAGFPPNPILCSPRGGVIRVSGSHFLPMPRDVLTDNAGVELPTVSLQSASDDIVLSGVTYEPNTGDLIAVVPENTPAGTYDVVVTNPNGKSGSLNGALEITETCRELELCSSVDPAFGWVNGRTRIDICANNAAGTGLLPVPQVILVIDEVTQVPLIRESMLSQSTAAGGFADASLMSAVVPSSLEERGAGLVVGGPYDLIVINPDGSQGVITAAFKVVADPPPVITAVSPEQAEKGATVTITLSGANFKDPDSTADPRLARILLLTTDLEAGAVCTAPACYECADATFVSSTSITCNPPLAAMSSGVYLVRFEHLEDGAYADFASFSVTNPSANLSTATVLMPALNTARFAHASVYARDDLGNRFLYVAGGQSDTDIATALDSIEIAGLSRFGDASAWTVAAVALPGPRSGLSMVRHGEYLFVVGGADVSGTPQDGVYRARILGDDSVPVIHAPALETGGTLGAGTYTYRVAAIMGSGTDNEGGEGLPSDAESINLVEAGSVGISWQAVTGALSYRVYRTPNANDLAGTEVLIRAGINSTSYIDDGTANPGTDIPRRAGSVGEWIQVGTLSTDRTDAAATIARDAAGDAFLYVLGGVTSATSPDPTDSYEFAPLGADGSVGTFTVGDATMMGSQSSSGTLVAAPRAQHIGVTLNANNASRITELGEEYVVIAQGMTSTSVWADAALAKVDVGGQLLPWSHGDYSSSADRHGAMGFFANNFLFSFGGRKGSGGAPGGGVQSDGLTLVVCPDANASCATTDPPVLEISGGNAGVSMQAERYRGSALYVGGYFFFIGGTNNTTVHGSVERGGYAK